MSQNKINVEVTDGGSLKELNAEATKLRQNLDNAGKGYVKAAASARVAAQQEGKEYGVARGAVGTGAASRDFAKQAQGLGGLVHLYATFAANIFAVSAAFNALQKAADTSNMEKGMNQLGASSGLALGTIAKQFSNITDGAISAREAMEAVTKATSAGLSTKQTLAIATSAKKASQALGIDMGDAVGRLTRGISKLEPELLDELGLFTRVDKATQDYARSVGKSTSQLSDFEKRQAFANAVLKEAKDKFNDIDLAANPYTKLLASMKNLAQDGLEVINKVLGPIAKYLSESPTALASAMGLVALTLIKQAIPAIGQYRAGLEEAAKSSKKLAESRLAAANAAHAEATAHKTKAIDSIRKDAAIDAADRIDAAEAKLRTATKNRFSKQVSSVLEETQNTELVTKAHLDIIDKYASKSSKLAPYYRELHTELKAVYDLHSKTEQKIDDINKKAAKSPGLFSARGLLQMQSDASSRSATSRGAISSAYNIVAEGGSFSDAWKNSLKLMSEAPVKMGLISRSVTLMGTAFAATAAKIELASIALNRVFMVVGIAIAAYEVLSGIFSTNDKAVSAFKSSLDALDSTTMAATKTNEKYGNSISIASLSAKSNSLDAMANSVEEVSNNFSEAIKQSSGFNNAIDNMWSLINKGAKDDLAKKLVPDISQSIKAISDPKLKQEYTNALQDIFNTTDLSEKNLAKIFNAASKEDAVLMVQKLARAMGDVNDSTKKALTPLLAMQDGFKQLNTDFQALSNSLINNDPVTKFAVSLINQSNRITDALKDPQNSVAALQSILSNTANISMFPAEMQSSILEAATNISELNTKLVDNANNIEQSKTNIAKYTAELIKLEGASNKNYTTIAGVKFNLEFEKKNLDQLNTAAANLQNAVKTATADLPKAARVGVAEGVKLLEGPISRAIAQGNIDANKAILGYLPKSIQTIDAQAKLEIQSIGLRQQEISQTERLISTIEADRLSREKQQLTQERSYMQRQGIAVPEELNKQIADLEKKIEIRGSASAAKTFAGSSDASIDPEFAARTRGFMTKMAEFNSKITETKLKSQLDKVGLKYDEDKKASQEALATLQARKAELIKSDAYRGMSTEAQNEAVDRLDNSITTLSNHIDNLDLEKQKGVATAATGLSTDRGVVDAAKEALREADRELAKKKEVQEIVKATAEDETDRSRAISSQNIALELTKSKYEGITLVEEQIAQAKEASLNLELQTIDVLKSRGAIDEDSYTARKASIDLQLTAISNARELNKIERDHLVQLDTIKNRKSEAKSPEEQAQIKQDEINEQQRYINLKEGVEATTAAKRAGILATKDMTTSMKVLNDWGQKFSDTFSDAIYDATQTGKWDFKDMVNSMIADLGRLMLKQQMSNALAAAGGTSGVSKGVGDLISMGVSYFTGGSSTALTTGTNTAPDYASQMLKRQANGGAWMDGVQAFAKGGTFTNSVINSPTLFKFAKGTGLMGEAGPEAIMPLSRDSSGKLGVSANMPASETTVVINNYSNTQATAKESLDSRGQRRVEVTIGDMVAGEIARAGSSAQQSIKSSFGKQPQLLRR